MEQLAAVLGHKATVVRQDDAAAVRQLAVAAACTAAALQFQAVVGACSDAVSAVRHIRAMVLQTAVWGGQHTPPCLPAGDR